RQLVDQAVGRGGRQRRVGRAVAQRAARQQGSAHEQHQRQRQRRQRVQARQRRVAAREAPIGPGGQRQRQRGPQDGHQVLTQQRAAHLAHIGQVFHEQVVGPAVVFADEARRGPFHEQQGHEGQGGPGTQRAPGQRL